MIWNHNDRSISNHVRPQPVSGLELMDRDKVTYMSLFDFWSIIVFYVTIWCALVANLVTQTL